MESYHNSAKNIYFALNFRKNKLFSELIHMLFYLFTKFMLVCE